MCANILQTYVCKGGKEIVATFKNRGQSSNKVYIKETKY